MTIRAVLFDLDDTLIDTTGSNRARAERIAQRLAIDIPGLDWESFVERAVARDAATGWSFRVDPLLKELGIEGTPLGLEARELSFFQGCLDLASSLPGTREAIERLASDYVLGVITNGLEYRQRSKFEALGIHERFQVFLTSERAGTEKPSLEIFLMALGEAGVRPDEAVFVGDRLDVDVGGARNAGMATVWLDHLGRTPAGIGPEPDARIESFAELTRVILQLDGLASDATSQSFPQVDALD